MSTTKPATTGDDERLWNALEYRIKAAHDSCSRARRQAHLDQASLYLNALKSELVPQDLSATDAPERAWRISEGEAFREWVPPGTSLYPNETAVEYIRADLLPADFEQLAALRGAALEAAETIRSLLGQMDATGNRGAIEDGRRVLAALCKALTGSTRTLP